MWIAAESGDLATALIPAVWTFLGIVVTTLGVMYQQSRRDRAERTSQPVTTGNGNGSALLQVARDVAHDLGQLDQRANDTDAAIDVIDRARAQDRKDLDAVLHYLDHRDSNWRHR